MINQYYWSLTDEFVSHHGIQGQKWGIRRYQDKNGRLTAEGKKRRSEYYDNGLKKPKGRLVIYKEVGSDLTDAGKQFKKDVENHVVDFYASMPEERLKKIRDTYSEYRTLDNKWRASDEPLTDKELKRLGELEKEWDDMSYNLTKECMGEMSVLDKDAHDIAWHAHYDTSKDIYEGFDPKVIKSERERLDSEATQDKSSGDSKVKAALSKVADIGTDIATNVAATAITKKIFG